jgi:hypothetical protein
MIARIASVSCRCFRSGTAFFYLVVHRQIMFVGIYNIAHVIFISYGTDSWLVNSSTAAQQHREDSPSFTGPPELDKTLYVVISAMKEASFTYKVASPKGRAITCTALREILVDLRQ